MSNSWRDFGNKNGVDQNYIFSLGIMFGLVNGSCRFLWGYLMDKFGFKPLMSTIAGIELFLAGSLYFLVKIPALFVICILLIATCIGGHFSILAPLFNKVYGVEIGPQCYGICGFCIGVSNLIGPLLCMFILKKNTDFLIAYLFGGSLVLIKIFSLIMFDENEKFNFDEINLGQIDKETENEKTQNQDQNRDSSVTNKDQDQNRDAGVTNKGQDQNRDVGVTDEDDVV